jgi:hypothetical protein
VHDEQVADAAEVGVLLAELERRAGGHRPADREWFLATAMPALGIGSLVAAIAPHV